MNKNYRVVWNSAKSCWMAAPESAHGKNPHATVVRSVCALSMLGMGMLAQAATPTATAASGNTRTYVAPNGVTVVDIATANSAGVSNNLYTEYNVNKQGLVLNNANSSQLTRQSQLAGQVSANMNLTREASLILNQVVSSSRTTLAGYTEVLGSMADVVVANPNGITCDGCGFLNTNRVTLTTGIPRWTAGGGLDGFDVSRGDILVQGDGLNAASQQILDLLGRRITLSGQVNAQALGLYAGANRWSYLNRAVTGSVAAAGDTPEYAIDTSTLGSMYVNSIFMIATDAGVGVRMLGNAAASAGDFTLSAAGKIEIASQLSATQDLQVSTSGSGGISLTGAALTASRNLGLEAAQGSVALTDGRLYASNDLEITAGTLSDASGSAAVRFAEGTQTINVTGAAVIDGAQYGAGGHLGIATGSLAVGSGGATLYSGSNTGAADRDLSVSASQGDVDLANASVQSPGALSVSAARGAVSVAAGGELKGVSDVSLAAATRISNAGSVSSDGRLGVQASDALATLENTGTLHAAGGLRVYP